MQDGRSQQSCQNAVQGQSQTGISSVFTAHFHGPAGTYRMRSGSHRQSLCNRASHMAYLQYLEAANGSEQSHDNHYGCRQRRNSSYRIRYFMAIGVVTDFGANDMITCGEAPISLAMTVTATSPTIQPAN